MKRIAICSVDNRARETAEWLSVKLSKEYPKKVRVLDYRVEVKHYPYCLEVETTMFPEIDIHIGTRYDSDLAMVTEGDFLLKMIMLIERLSKTMGHDMSYDMVFIIYNSEVESSILARDYENLYNLKTKILPNRPASIVGRMIYKLMKFAHQKEKK